MRSAEIREKFLKYFESKGHKVLPGSSLIPKDPTVLLTLAGMLQFKPIFLGQEKPEHKRATTVQKCLRMNDIENVGKTARHHTFFEMLGNFSFGNYFKREAIGFAWELLVKEFKLPVDRLSVAVFKDDNEAYDLWEKEIGLPASKLFRLDEDNNFWAAGPTGPCGPCSEIYYDQGQDKGCGKPDCQPGCACDRFLEVWNLVFIQYDRNDKGELIPLTNKGIDTGMGLERIASILQGVDDNFKTDLFVPLITKVKSFTSRPEPAMPSLKIIADHVRAVTHLVGDGVIPENVGRGYVLRRLIRRAIRHGRLIGIEKPFMPELAAEVIKDMGQAYPQLKEKSQLIYQIVQVEEANFLATLQQGIDLLKQLIAPTGNQQVIAGEAAFKLHDTLGFPVELTQEIAGESNFTVDLPSFERLMEEQRERGRRAGISSDKKSLPAVNLPATKFVGYEKLEDEGKVLAVIKEQKYVVLDKTPFYGESGGQVGDTGILSVGSKMVRVLGTLIDNQGVIFHQVEDATPFKVGQKVKATIDQSKRGATAIHHTATHLLQKALKEVLGEQVHQAGSSVAPDKLRFDFTHFAALQPAEMEKVEQIVNQKIAEKLKVEVLQKSYKEAVAMGALALFGEKYGDRVRVLKIDNYSLELCGGTHVKSTADISFFKITSEGSLGAGVRRIEAIAGQAAKIAVIYKAKALRDQVEKYIARYRELQMVKEQLGGGRFLETGIFEVEFTELDRLGKCVDNHDPVSVNKFLEHLTGRVDWLEERIAKAEKEIAALRVKQLAREAAGFVQEVQEIKGIKFLIKEFKAYDLPALRAISDEVQRTQPGVVVLFSSTPGKVLYLVTVSPQAIAAGLSAKKLAAELMPPIEGKGGGRDDKAEGGGKEPAGIPAATAAVIKVLGG